MKTPVVAYLYPNPSQLEIIKADLEAARIREENEKSLRAAVLQDFLRDVFLRDFDVDDQTPFSPFELSPFEVALDDLEVVNFGGGKKQSGFVWVTHKGARLYPCDMATPHLFYSLRMVFNHSVPPVFRVLGPGEEMNRYRDVPYWTADYRREALTQLTAELDSRDDLDEPLRDQLADIKSNCAVILALGL
jgi:hypothetical protein